MTLSYDGTALISGHENGKIHGWDIAKGRYNKLLIDFAAPVTNLYMLLPTGFPNQPKTPFKMVNVVKPRYESSLSSSSIHPDAGNSLVPNVYTFTAQFTTTLPPFRSSSPFLTDPMADFDAALTHPSFPTCILDEGIAALTSPSNKIDHSVPLDSALQQENAMLKAQLMHARAAQQAHAENAIELGNEILRRDGVEKAKKRGKRLRRIRKEEVMEDEGPEDLSSDTDELTGSE